MLLRASGSSARILLEVADTGPGLTPQQLELVFDRFYRGDSSHSRDRGGSGLGLAIAKSIVEAHDDMLRVHSDLGNGTTFTIELPAAPSSL